jgi:hypothetical protein
MPCLVAVSCAWKYNISCKTPTSLLHKQLTYSSISSDSGNFPLLGSQNGFLDLLVVVEQLLSVSSSSTLNSDAVNS